MGNIFGDGYTKQCTVDFCMICFDTSKIKNTIDIHGCSEYTNWDGFDHVVIYFDCNKCHKVSYDCYKNEYKNVLYRLSKIKDESVRIDKIEPTGEIVAAYAI